MKPEYYRTPLKKKHDIINFITSRTTSRHYWHDWYQLCWNVKCYDCDLSFEHLLDVYRDNLGEEDLSDVPGWQDFARHQHELHENQLWEWGIEYARGYFIGDGVNDTFFMTWEGKSLDVSYGFIGRSGGWLTINDFEGYTFWGAKSSCELSLMDMEYPELRDLYKLVTILCHDLRHESVRDAIEQGAAWDLFSNIIAPEWESMEPPCPAAAAITMLRPAAGLSIITQKPIRRLLNVHPKTR